MRSENKSNRVVPAVVAGIFIAASTCDSLAIIRRHDRDDQLYIDLATNYPAVGQFIVNGASSGSGTLIAPSWVLTAGHCVFLDGYMVSGKQFAIKGRSYDVEFAFPHAQAVPAQNHVNAEYDIALVRLAEPVADVEPAILYAGNPDDQEELGKVLTIVGYGFGGTGADKPTRILPPGTKRAARNMVDSIGAGAPDQPWEWPDTVLMADFDNPRDHEPDADNFFGKSNEPLDLEGAMVTGDSGGGGFIDFGRGPELVSVNSGNVQRSGWAREPVYGTISHFTRVAPFRDWILNVMQVADGNAAGNELPVVTVAAVDHDDPDYGEFVFSITQDAGFPLMVYFETSGSSLNSPLTRGTNDLSMFPMEKGPTSKHYYTTFIPFFKGVTNVAVGVKADKAEGTKTLTVSISPNALYRVGDAGQASVILDPDR